MGNANTAIIIASALIGLGLLALYVILFLRRRLRYIKEVRIELGRAYTEAAYLHWKRELRVARICLIPFVSPAFARKLIGRKN